jgi:uncharacterized protein (UPF0305 family)
MTREQIIEIGKKWGIKSNHSEWTDEEALNHFADELLAFTKQDEPTENKWLLVEKSIPEYLNWVTSQPVDYQLETPTELTVKHYVNWAKIKQNPPKIEK